MYIQSGVSCQRGARTAKVTSSRVTTQPTIARSAKSIFCCRRHTKQSRTIAPRLLRDEVPGFVKRDAGQKNNIMCLARDDRARVSSITCADDGFTCSSSALHLTRALSLSLCEQPSSLHALGNHRQVFLLSFLRPRLLLPPLQNLSAYSESLGDLQMATPRTINAIRNDTYAIDIGQSTLSTLALWRKDSSTGMCGTMILPIQYV